jgi:hypothetical protein
VLRRLLRRLLFPIGASIERAHYFHGYPWQFRGDDWRNPH